MSRALDSTESIQKLVKEWTEDDIVVVNGIAGSIIDSKESPEDLILFARFAIVGALYIQARKIETQVRHNSS